MTAATFPQEKNKCNDNADTVNQIKKLQLLLKERPKNGRGWAKLACLIWEQQQQQSLNDKTTGDLTTGTIVVDEAIQLAKHSIEVAPDKPYGYVALSMILQETNERIVAIQNALARCCRHHRNNCANNNKDIKQNQLNNDSIDVLNSSYLDSSIPLILLARLLIEQRNEEKRQYRNNFNVTTTKKVTNPAKRSFTVKEEEIYQEISMLEGNDVKLVLLDGSNSITSKVGLVLYRLGLLLRKMEPIKDYRPRSIDCFQRSLPYLCHSSSDLISSSKLTSSNSNDTNEYWYRMVEFWLATMNATSTSNNNNTKSENGSTSCNNNNIITKCPPEYIVALYSTFSERFDTLLVDTLNYRTPTLLRQLVDECIATSNQVHQTCDYSDNYSDNPLIIALADLGCGTGLAGMTFQNVSCKRWNNNTNKTKTKTIMIGVDLSPEMIEKAKQRQCYDDLHVGDITTVLAPLPTLKEPKTEGRCQEGNVDDLDGFQKNNNDRTYAITGSNSHSTTTFQKKLNNYYTLVFACDVFVYIGDLQEIVQRTFHSLIHGGIFAFSTELLLFDKDRNFILHSCARFAHSESYIRKISLEAGFTILGTKTCSIRKNLGKDVIGLLIVLRKDVK